MNLRSRKVAVRKQATSTHSIQASEWKVRVSVENPNVCGGEQEGAGEVGGRLDRCFWSPPPCT